MKETILQKNYTNSLFLLSVLFDIKFSIFNN